MLAKQINQLLLLNDSDFFSANIQVKCLDFIGKLLLLLLIQPNYFVQTSSHTISPSIGIYMYKAWC